MSVTQPWWEERQAYPSKQTLKGLLLRVYEYYSLTTMDRATGYHIFVSPYATICNARTCLIFPLSISTNFGRLAVDEVFEDELVIGAVTQVAVVSVPADKRDDLLAEAIVGEDAVVERFGRLVDGLVEDVQKARFGGENFVQAGIGKWRMVTEENYIIYFAKG